MRHTWDVNLLARLLIPLIIIPLLGISPRPHIVSQIMHRASLSMKAGATSEVSLKLSRLIEHLPWRQDLRELAAFFALEAGDPFTAILHFQQLAERHQLSPKTQMYMGDAALLADDLPLAIDSWNASLERGGSPIDLLPRLYQAYQNLGNYPAQIEVLRSLVTFMPSNAAYHYQLGLLLTISQPESSLVYLLRAAELDPSLSPKVQTIQNNLNTARLENDPVYTQMVLGRALASIEEWGYALEAFHQVTQARPDYAEAWAFLGEARYHLSEDGLGDLHRSLDLDPQSTAANTFIAIYWQRQGRYDLAFDYLYAAAQVDPQNPALQAEIGNTLAHLGDINEAQVYYQHATELSPRDPTYWQALARFSIKYEYDIQQLALPAARQALLLNHDDPVSLDLMGQIYIRLDDPLTAERFLLRSLETNPDYASAHLHLGFLYLMSGETQKALDELTIARSLAQPGSSIADQAWRLLQSNFPHIILEQH
jgi:tetratricopeptide (TPR) repeat protein